MKKALFKKLMLLALLPLGVLLTVLAAKSPNLVESFYSRGIFRVCNSIISNMTGIVPYSLAEVLLLCALIIIAVFITKTIGCIVKDKERRRKYVSRLLFNTLVVINILYFGFILLWGLNYYRLPFSEIAGLDVEKSSVEELEGLTRLLIERANILRAGTAEDSRGVMRLKEGRDKVYTTIHQGFDKANTIYPQLGGRFGRPKKVLLSTLMSYAGISGIYFPFTGEANVNNSIPDYMLPSTASHEMAHQRGFAREDEANYIAYLTTTMHDNPDFQYSGTLLALVYTINTLYENNPDLALKLRAEYSDGVRRDLMDWSRFWQQYEGPVEKISREVNDTYLKANRQEDGVKSYDRMVQLLLAEYRLQQL